MKACRNIMNSSRVIKILFTPVLLFLFTQISFGQAIQPGCVSGNFGIDAGVSANRLEFISGSASGTDDWVKLQNGTGIQVIDTTGAAAYRTFYTNNPSQVNSIFTKKMPFGYYELASGNNMLDGIFYRDYFGGGNSSGNIDDSTGFISSCKNGDDPTIWSGGYVTMQNKTDIIDVYGHIRRVGTSINGQMWLYCAMSVVSPNGNRYVDFEFLQEKLAFNKATGVFSNVGPHEGHTAYQFDATGNITAAGDVIFTVASGNGEPTLELRIWVARSVYDAWKTTPPADLPFRFSGSFDGSTNYGYASIIQKTGTYYDACGKVNTSATTPAGPWGTINSSSNYSTTYDASQFIEMGFNLSSVGLDPLKIAGGTNPCGPAFQTFFAKSRASSSFTAALKDFAGPLDFGGPPNYTMTISSTTAITCDSSQATLTANVSPSTNNQYFTWTHPDGTTQTGTNLRSIRISKPGTYTVAMSPIQGCAVIGTATYNQPIDTITPAVPSNPQNAAYCSGTSVPSISVDAPASGHIIQWWSAATGGTLRYTGNVYSPGTPGTYYAEVKKTFSGCESSRIPVVLTQNTTPVVTVSASPGAICQGQSSTLSFSGTAGVSVVGWYVDDAAAGCRPSGSSLGSGTTVAVYPMATTTYNVVVETAAGCRDTACAVVTVYTKPDITASTTAGTICQGQSSPLTFSPTVGMTVIGWYTDDAAAGCTPTGSSLGNGAGQTVYPNATTTYSVVVTSTMGCRDTSCVMVNVNTKPDITAIATPATICQGQSSTLSFSTNVGVSVVGWYLDNNAAGCSPTGASLGTGNTLTVSPMSTTTYLVIVVSAAGCRDTSCVTVTVNTKPNITASATPATICQGQGSTLSFSPAGGLTVVGWYLDDAAAGCTPTGSSLATTDNFTVYPMSTTTYSVVVTTSSGCLDTACVTVTVNTKPDISASASLGTVCEGKPTVLSFSPTAGLTVVGWYNTSGGCDPTGSNLGTGLTLTVNPIITSTYAVVVQTAQGCRDTACVTVNVNPKPSPQAVFSLAPCADANGYTAQIAAVDPAPHTGVWSKVSGPGNITDVTQLTTSITGLSTTGATTVVKWQVTTAAGCIDSILLNITPPVANLEEVSVFSSYYCLTCPVKDGNTYYYYDLDGKLAAKVEDVTDGVAAGSTEICCYLDYNVANPPASTDIQTVPNALGYDQPYAPRHWTVNVPSNANVNVTLYFTEAEAAAIMTRSQNSPFQYNNTTGLVTTIYDNGSGSHTPAGSSNGTLVTPTFTNVSSPRGPYWGVTFQASGSSTVYLHPQMLGGGPLPVEMISFVAIPKEEVIQLDWYTATENNNDYFEVERSIDGKYFDKIGSMKGAGFSNTTQEYTLIDDNVVAGKTYYYRLKQVAFDGSFEYSEIVSAMIVSMENLSVSEFTPNPTKAYSRITVEATEAAEVKFYMFTLEGKGLLSALYQLDKGSNEFSFDFSGLEPGIYYGLFDTPEGQALRKLVKIK